jgi:hypothetical protein
MGSIKRGAVNKEEAGESEEIYFEISPAERAVARAIQSKKPGEPKEDWEATAGHLKVSVAYLKALVRIRLPENTNLIPMSSLNFDPDEYLEFE